MFDRRCARCGSTSFRADRSLGGRLVCSHCAVPADQQARRSSGGGRLLRSSRSGSGGYRFWILLAVIALVLVLLFQSA